MELTSAVVSSVGSRVTLNGTGDDIVIVTDDTNTDMLDDQAVFSIDVLRVELPSDLGGPNPIEEEQITLTVSGVVLNVPNNTQGSLLTNTAIVQVGEVMSTASVDVEIVETNLDIQKSVSNETPNLDEVVTYTLTVTHDQLSTLDAYDLTITDQITDGRLQLVAGSVTVTDAPAGTATGITITSGNTPMDTDIQIDVDELTLAGQLIITYDVLITDAIADLGATLSNTATVNFDNIPGDNPNSRAGTAAATETVEIIGADLIVSKDDSIDRAAPGDIVTYNITVINKPTATDTATDVIVTDRLPDGVSFVSATNGGVFDESNRTVTFNIASIRVETSQTVSITVIVDNAEAGLDVITNSVSVIHDDPDPTPADNQTSHDLAIDAAPSLTIDKDDGVATALVGDRLTYTITVTNDGNQDASGVMVTDTFPASILGNILTNNAGTVDTNAGTISWSLGTIRAGFGVVLTVEADVLDEIPAGFDDIVNSVVVTDDGAGTSGVPITAQDTDIDTLVATPDYFLTKTDGLATVAPGETIEYTLELGNRGNQGGTGVTVIDTFDAELLTNVTANQGGVVNADTGTILWNLGDLPVGETLTLTVTATVANVIPLGVVDLLNTAMVFDDGNNGADPNVDDNTANDQTTVEGAPDLVVNKTDRLASIEPGDPSEYTIVVTNEGSRGATNVIVTDDFDPNLFTPAFASDNGVIDLAAGTVTWALGTVEVGDILQLTLSGTVTTLIPAGAQDLTNVVTVADDGNNGVDPTPENNTSTDNTAINAAPLLTIDKDDGVATALVGDRLTYTITVSNDGNQDASGVLVTDTFPAGILGNILANNAGTVDTNAGTISWSLGTIRAGFGVVLTVEADVLDEIPAGFDDIVNSVVVMDDGAGTSGVPITAQDTDTDTLVATPDYFLTKTDGLATVAPGETIEYTLELGNRGNQGGTGVTVIDTFDAELLTNVTANQGGVVNANTGTILWNLGGLPVGETLTLTVTATVANVIPIGVVDLLNTATVFDDGNNGVDPTTENNTDTDNTTIDVVPRFAVTKTNDSQIVSPGDVVTYVITVNNDGNQNATGITVVDVFDSQVFGNVRADQGGVVDLTLGTVTWNVSELSVGETLTFRVTVTISDTLVDGVDTLTNTVLVTDDGSGNNGRPVEVTASDTDDVAANPDYVITKTDNLRTAFIGDDVTYVIEVSNVGNQGGTGVVVTDLFPSELLTNLRPSAGGIVNVAAGTITWTLGTLAAGETITLQVTGTISLTADVSNSPLHNEVNVRDDGRNGEDPTPQNNTAVDDTNLMLRSPVAPESTLPAFVYDSLRNDSDISSYSLDDYLNNYERELPVVTPTPIYSGTAEPGTTITVFLFDHTGATIGSQTVVSDSAGNWLTSLPNQILREFPHGMQVVQDLANHNDSTSGAFNFRTYFTPAVQSQVFFSHSPSVDAVFGQMAHAVVHSLHVAVNHPIQVGWSNTYAYEFLTSSTTTTQYAQ